MTDDEYDYSKAIELVTARMPNGITVTMTPERRTVTLEAGGPLVDIVIYPFRCKDEDHEYIVCTHALDEFSIGTASVSMAEYITEQRKKLKLNGR